MPPSARSDEGATVVAPIWWGPEIMFRTDLDVVATPYHRNHTGILASRDIMASTDDVDLLGLLHRREVRYVAVCRVAPWSPLLTDPDPRTLFSRLIENEPPTYLRPIPLGPEFQERYGFWAVDGGATPGGLAP